LVDLRARFAHWDAADRNRFMALMSEVFVLWPDMKRAGERVDLQGHLGLGVARVAEWAPALRSTAEAMRRGRAWRFVF
jgi:hypothetical protein